MSAARGALLVIYLAAIGLMAYAFFGSVDRETQLTLVVVGVVLFGLGSLMPANRSNDGDGDAR